MTRTRATSLTKLSLRILEGLTLAAVLAWATPAQAGTPNYLYYSQFHSNPGDGGSHGAGYYIGQAVLGDPAATSVNDYFIQTLGQPWGVALDGAGFIYWADFTNGYIGKATTAGVVVNQHYINTGGTPAGLAIGTDGGGNTFIYWADPTGNSIGRANITIPATPVVTTAWITCPNVPVLTDPTGGNVPASPTGVTVNTTDIYWTQRYDTGPGNGIIGHAGIPSTPTAGPVAQNDNFIYPLNSPTDIKINSSSIYWLTYGDSTIGTWLLSATGGTNNIQPANSQYVELPGAGDNPDGFHSICLLANDFVWGGEAMVGASPVGLLNVNTSSSAAGYTQGSLSSAQLTAYEGYLSSPLGSGFYGIAITNAPTVITLTSFTAQVKGAQVDVAWTTGSEVDTVGFNVLRSTAAAGPFTQVNTGLVPAQGTGAGGASYTFLDASATSGQTYYYELVDLDNQGQSTIHGPVSVAVGTGSAIRAFQATPANLFQGGSALLSWATNGSPALALQGAPVSGSSLWVAPAATTAYQLTDAQGDASLITVNVAPFTLKDLAGLSKAWGSTRGQAAYDASYDLNGDGKVDDADVALCFAGM